MDTTTGTVALVTGFGLLLGLRFLLHFSRDKFDQIPTSGFTNGLLSYINAFEFKNHAYDVLQRGHEKFPGSLFRIAAMRRWVVIVTKREHIEDIQNAGSRLTFVGALAETLESIFDLDDEILEHGTMVRTSLSRTIASRFEDMHDEIAATFNDALPAEDHEWTSVPGSELVFNVVGRTTNRAYVGLPLCRDPDYVNLNVDFTHKFVLLMNQIGSLPITLPSFVLKHYSGFAVYAKRAASHIEPIIQDRLEQEAMSGPKWPGKPNDLITWLLDITSGEGRSAEKLGKRMLTLNVAAIQTIATAFTHSLFHLAAQPEYLEPLREEIDSVVAKEGWTKGAISHMHRVDSFIKEAMRVNGFDSLTMNRQAPPEGFTFSDGTKVPGGTYMGVFASAAHHDPENYERPTMFDGFRFSKLREETDRRNAGKGVNLVDGGPGFVLFGSGEYVCPGKTWGAYELKLMLAHMVSTYDVRFEEEGVRPPNEWLGVMCVPNQSAKVQFRKRSV